MIQQLTSRFKSGPLSVSRKSPPDSKLSNASSTPKDRADLALQNFQKDSATAPKPPKPGLFPMLGAAALLGLTGLGLLQGASQAQPPRLPEVESVQETPSVNPGTELLTQMDVTPEMHVAGRHGTLLGSGHILKFDQFPGMRNERLAEQMDGAPNFRQVEGTEVYGVAQPTVDGMRQVLDRVGAKDRTVNWTSMREEPVVYVNGRSFSLRELAHPFENAAQFEGNSGEQVERTEQQLKAEVLAEARANGGRLLVHDEGPDGMTSEWVTVTPETVKTTREVYQDLQAEGYKVDYARVPVSDEKSPETGDLQSLIARVNDVDQNTPQIFNCHAGRGRTTTAMVATQLIQQANNPQSAERFSRVPAVREDIREQGRYEAGNYRLILSLINRLSDGTNVKAETDAVLDRTEDMQNLRTDINRYRKKSLNSDDPSSAQRAESRGLDYLHRYHTLITFNQYVKEQAPEGFEVTFEEWLELRPELTEMLESFELAMRTPGTTPGQSQYA